MSGWRKTLRRVLSGTSDKSIRFDELRGLLLRLGFDERVRGSHHIFSKGEIEEILNLQSAGGMSKPYQVKQVREVIVAGHLATDDEDNDGGEE